MLKRRLYLLVLLTLLTAALLSLAHDDTHRRPAMVREATGPAVREIAVARNALLGAHRAARDGISSPAVDVVGAGEEYRTQIAVATRSLSRTADRQVAGSSGERALATVNALLTSYDYAVDTAVRHATPEPGREGEAECGQGERRRPRCALAEAWFGSAEATLKRDGTGILSRLGDLQDDQLDELRRQTAFTDLRWAMWCVAGTALLLLTAALALTQWQLGRRFPQRLNPWLLLASALVLASAAPLTMTWQTQQDLEDARTRLEALVDRQPDVHVELSAPPDAATDGKVKAWQADTERSARVVRGEMDAASGRRWLWLVAILPGGAVAALAVPAGLHRHRALYRPRS
ncbi:hypothetical protein GCM10027168_16830 [Streptomyces capparidis]